MAGVGCEEGGTGKATVEIAADAVGAAFCLLRSSPFVRKPRLSSLEPKLTLIELQASCHSMPVIARSIRGLESLIETADTLDSVSRRRD